MAIEETKDPAGQLHSFDGKPASFVINQYTGSHSVVWYRHGAIHREVGKTEYFIGHEDEMYWDLYNVNLRGRMLLW